MSVDVALPETPTERALASVWEEALGFSPVGRDDTFEDVGGTSIAAERVLATVRRTLALQLTPAMLIGRPTLAEIAARLDEARRAAFSRRAPDYTEFPAEASAAHDPIFCIVGAGSSAVAYIPLVNRIGGDRAVFAFHQHGFFSRGFADWTVRAQARRHVRTIRRLQPAGPYSIVGHSYGAHVALQTALILEQQGATVERVVALDPVLKSLHGGSVADASEDVTPPPLRERLRTHARIAVAGIVQFDPATQQSVFWERGIRAQNRFSLDRTPSNAVIVVTEENAAQAELWRNVPGDHHVVHVEGTHIGVMSGARQLDLVDELTRRGTYP